MLWRMFCQCYSNRNVLWRMFCQCFNDFHFVNDKNTICVCVSRERHVYYTWITRKIKTIIIMTGGDKLDPLKVYNKLYRLFRSMRWSLAPPCAFPGPWRYSTSTVTLQSSIKHPIQYMCWHSKNWAQWHILSGLPVSRFCKSYSKTVLWSLWQYHAKLSDFLTLTVKILKKFKFHIQMYI